MMHEVQFANGTGLYEYMYNIAVVVEVTSQQCVLSVMVHAISTIKIS